MSHEIKVAIEVKDLKAFEQAIVELGGRFHKGQRTYTKYREQAPCDHAASFPGINYQIGLKANDASKRSFSPVWDTYGYGQSQNDGHKLVERCGPNMGRLKQTYGLRVAENAARKRGHTTRRKQKADGTVQLVIGG